MRKVIQKTNRLAPRGAPGTPNRPSELLKISSSRVGSFTVVGVRTFGGIVAALLLAFVGDIAARVFNLSVSFAWDPAVHQNAHFIGIGLGAGIGSFLGWVNPNMPKLLLVGSLLLVVLGGIGGAYLGRGIGPGVDTSYWWGRFATDKTVYLGAVTVGIFLSTTLGFIWQAILVYRVGNRHSS